MINIPFDQYQRYKTTADIIENSRKNDETFRILEVGANAHRNLERFLPNDYIVYIDIDFPKNLQDEHMIQGDATDMTFKDNSFDIVIALDVYEHIPYERRNLFLKEINRVSKIGFIIGAPFDYDKTKEAEYRVNSLYRSLYGTDFIWLKEHIVNSLPSVKNTKECLENNNIQYIMFYHGNIDIWEKMMSIYFLSRQNSMVEIYKDELDMFYNKYIYPLDFDDNGFEVYRSFIIGGELSKIQKIKDVISVRNKDKRNDEYKRLLSLCDNFVNVINKDVNLSKEINEFIEVFADDSNIKINITEEEIISNQYVEKFIPIEEEIIKKGIRIDPCNKKCLIYIENIFLKNEEKIDIAEYTTTSTTNVKNIYYFDKDDPQIQITNCIGKKITGLIVKFKYIQYDNIEMNPISYIIELLSENTVNENKLLEDQINRLKNIENILKAQMKDMKTKLFEKELAINELRTNDLENKKQIENLKNINSEIMSELKSIKSMPLWKLIEWIWNRRQ